MQTIAYPLAVGGLLTRVMEAGQGPAILFIHGLGARADRWAGTVSLMAQAGFRAIACDLPGHGFATKGDDCPADVPGMADFISALLDKLEIDSVFLVGTSLGAHIAAYVACGNPPRFPKLALVGALGIVPLAQETAETIRRNVKAAGREQITAKLRYVMYNPAMVTDALIEEEWRMNNSPGALTSFTKIGDYLVDGISQHYVAEKLRAAYTPDQLLLVWGENDGSVPLAVGTACQAVLGQPELLVIPHAGHAPYFEQPEMFQAALAKFLKT
jgi:pimeloyl-ACP methyl ester carboxylesterase